MEPEVVFNFQQGPYWGWQVATDLFLGGAGVGALLFAIFLDEVFKSRYRRICHTAAWLSVLLVSAGLGFLLFKIGRPFHLVLTYTALNPHAPLWWGGVFQPMLIIGSLCYAIKLHRTLDWNNEAVQMRPQDTSKRILGWVLAPLALIVGGYHGLILAVVTARPLWNTGPTVVAAMLGFVATGISAVMLCHLLRMKVRGRLSDEAHVSRFLDDIKCVRNALVATLILQLFTFFVWWLSLNYGSLQDKQALAAANEAFGSMFWYLGIGVGLVAPLSLGAFAVWRRVSSNRQLQIAIITFTSVLILVGGFFFRLGSLLAGQLALPISSLF